jgi:hypothetical protein
VPTLITKLKDVFDQLKKIYEKIKPVIDKIQEVIKSVSETITAVQNLNIACSETSTLKPNMQSNDVYNVTAEWRNFDITVREMEATLSEYSIAGKQDYFHALKTLVNNGQAYILAQTNLVRCADELAILLLQGKIEKRDNSRLENLAVNVGTNKLVLEILKRAMFDRLLSIRSLVFLDFITYNSAYNYYSLRTGENFETILILGTNYSAGSNVVLLSPVKPIADYLDDLAKLQSAVISFGSTTLIQSRSFTLHTLCGYNSSAQLGSALEVGTSVSFSLGPEHILWQGFSRIRMSSVR